MDELFWGRDQWWDVVLVALNLGTRKWIITTLHSVSKLHYCFKILFS